MSKQNYNLSEICPPSRIMQTHLPLHKAITIELLTDKPTQRAVFLDRDGTINLDRGYISNPEDVEICKDVPLAINKLRELGLLIVVITNQAGVGKGIITKDQFDAVNARLWSLLTSKGCYFDALYYCPHTPEITPCMCRKPSPGMLYQAALDFNIELQSSFMVGDKTSDVLAGKNAGCSTILISPSHMSEKPDCPADWVAENLLEAYKWIAQN